MDSLSLEQELVECVRQERGATSEALRYLREAEKTKLYLRRGYSSLYAYCTQKLGYSEPEAQLRIQAMRLLRSAPEVLGMMRTGAISLSVAALIQGVVKRKRLGQAAAKALVKELAGKTKREAEEILAARFPGVVPREQVKAVTAEFVEIRFAVTKAELALIESLLDRRAHGNYERSHRRLYVSLVREQMKKYEKKHPEGAPQHGPGEGKEAKGRHIPQRIRDWIWLRDEGKCQFVDPDSGKKCGSKHGVQIDHIRPYSEGGSHSPDNLRLYCGAHNRWRHEA